MIRVNNVHIPLDYDDAAVRKRICRELRVDNSAVKSVSIFRRSVDARKKDNIFFLCAVDVVLNINEDNVLKKAKNASTRGTVRRADSRSKRSESDCDRTWQGRGQPNR